ncbi:MAG: peptidyl-prolyl cis-trans isomerase [Holosporaceae bacterium]|nr:MAG: peptidyl-prolyl cis-trans isomerase [Holosporaceae bacterium]
MVILDPQSYGEHVSVSEKELREYYNGNKETLTSPETRSFSIAVFDTKKAADSARSTYVKTKSGITFEKHEAMTQDVLSPEIGAIVFTLKKGDLSSVKSFQGKYALIKVDRIVAAQTKSFSDVRSTLVSDVRRQKAMEAIAKTVSKIEEGSNQGMSFLEIVKNYKLKAKQFTLDHSGVTEKGQSAKLASDIVKDIFSLHEGGENQITELADGTSYLVYIEKISPTRTLSFKEAQPKVEKEYANFFFFFSAEKAAARAAEDMSKGGKVVPTDAVSFLKIGLVSLSDQKKKSTVPARVLYQGFAQSKGVSSVIKEGSQIYVIKTTDVQKIKIEKNIGLYKAYREDVGRAISQSIYIGFLRDLKKIYNLKINQQALESLV